MKRPIQIVAFLSIISFNSFSQDTIQSKFTHSIYLEGGGIGRLYSLNYEIRVPVCGLRIGGAMMNYQSDANTNSPVFLMPIEFVLLPEYKSNGCPELGIAAIPVFGKRNYFEIFDPISSQEVSSNYAIYYALQIGYRYQTLDDHMIFRIDLTFLYIYNQSIFNSTVVDGDDTGFQLWGGIDFGYTFK